MFFHTEKVRTFSDKEFGNTPFGYTKNIEKEMSTNFRALPQFCIIKIFSKRQIPKWFDSPSVFACAKNFRIGKYETLS